MIRCDDGGAQGTLGLEMLQRAPDDGDALSLSAIISVQYAAPRVLISTHWVLGTIPTDLVIFPQIAQKRCVDAIRALRSDGGSPTLGY